MILQALCQYCRRLEEDPNKAVAPPGWAINNVSGCITLDMDGHVVNVVSLLEKKKFTRMLTPLPPKRSGKTPEATFLCDNPEFLFGIYKNKDGADYRFDASREKHYRVLDGVDDDGARAVLRFFDSRVKGGFAYEGVDTSALEYGGNFVFRLKGEDSYIHQRAKVRDAWEAYANASSEKLTVGQCLITGETGRIARLHGNFLGFGADKPTLVGFNQQSFISFAKSQGDNAPVSEKAAFEYVTALNALLEDRRHVVRIGDDKVVFWAERKADAEEDCMGKLQLRINS